MAYVLQQILNIRQMREDLAQKEVIKAQAVYQAAIDKVELKKKELEDFKVWRKEEEERLYAEIMNKKLKKIDIDELKSDLAKLEKKELDHVHAIDKAKEEREAAKEKLKEARAVHNATIIGVEKILEHKEAWMEEWNLEQERLAEIEVEDFKSIGLQYI